MRLGSFILIGSSESKDLDASAGMTPATNFIASGVNGASAISSLGIQPGSPIRFFTSHQGTSNEVQYGNFRMYNSGTVNTATELAVTQSFSTYVTGSIQADFIFLLESKHRG